MGQAQTTAASKRPIVLILGAGYGGVACAKLLDESGLCFVLLVDQKEFFLHTAGTPRALAQRHWAHKLLIPYDKLLKNGCVIHALVESITPTAVKLQGRTNDLAFDYLVLAMGANYSWPFQTQKRIVRQPSVLAASKESTPNSDAASADSVTEVAQPIYMMDTLSQFNAVYNQILAAKRIVIVGGGCVGIETAAEIAAAFGSKATTDGSKAAATSSPAVAPITPPNGTTQGGVISEPYLAEYAAKQQQQSQAPATPPSAQPAAAAKEIVLIHSGKDLLNRQAGLRDKMRALALKGLTDAGVQVLLQEKVDLDSVREMRGGGDIEKDVSPVLQSRGIFSASSGASLRFATIKALAPPADPSVPAPAFGIGGPHEADCIILCTGVKHDSLLYETDPEIRSCLDPKGRLIVNQFFQLEGSVDIERAAASAARGARADASGRGGPGRSSVLHTQFSFHYPHVFALGDCCVPKEEFKLNLNPQAYYAHKHAQAVARNITNLIQRYALRPYDGSGNASLFLSLGPEHGITQLPNRSQSICGDSQTKAWKSADMQAAANWTFLNQDQSKPSFRGRASSEFVAGEEVAASKDMVSVNRPDTSKEEQHEYGAEMASNGAPLIVGAAGVNPATPISAYAASSTFAVSPKGGYGAEPASPVAAHPNDSAEMSAQAAMVETKLMQMEQDAAAAETQPKEADATVPACAAVTSPNPRPLGTESLSVAVRGVALALPVSSKVASPSASSPIGPILLAEQERKFEEAMTHESDLIDAGLSLNSSVSPSPPPPPPLPQEDTAGSSSAASAAHHSPPRALHLEVDPPPSATSVHVSLNPFASPTAAAASVRTDPFATTPADGAAASAVAPAASICNPFAPPLESSASSSSQVDSAASTNPFAKSNNPFNESPAVAPAAGGNPFASPLNLNASPAAAAVRPLSSTERYNGFALQRQMQSPLDDSEEGNQQHEYEEA